MTEITTSTQGQTLVIRLNRPEKMNAITRDMYAGLAQNLNAAAEDDAIRCVVITSEGEHFTAGNDIRDFMSNPPTEEDSGVAKL
jgi:enoyl-CoA hydratase/carnithine racemase